ncbi:MAG: hypothetical protein A4E36_01759 [Methanoregulaceae archaeon PtaB.Bin009]|nr:MAG: hypothetical protein A4E36_01759 [Methanoregulaceae archaeon PtaB.Bin009]
MDIPKRPERSGISTALSPRSGGARNEYRKVNMPRSPDVQKTSRPHPGASLCTRRKPITATRIIPLAQSMTDWKCGMTSSRIQVRGTASARPVALPSAEILTASSPRPSMQRAWAGRTARAVSASGMPRNVLGTASMKQWVTSAEKRAAARKNGPKRGRRTARDASMIAASVLTWIPGRSPERSPSATPAAVPARISIILA